MRRRFAIFSVIVATLAAVAAGGVSVLSASAQEQKFEICHRTNSATNPYVFIEVSQNAVDGVGGGDHFGEHKGPLVTSEAEAQALKDQQVMWGDIIPPVPGVHGGQNLGGGGQEILDNGCVFEAPVTPTTQPVTPTTQPVAPTQPPGAAAAPPRPGAPAAPSAPRAPAAGAVAGRPRVTG